ncbi:hypothetical protein Y049_1480 [Burkholderia pseudomallei MSHR684]|nr:hypothetical protein Y049_1480 [Burkholderia pseudomallei MSHR684]
MAAVLRQLRGEHAREQQHHRRRDRIDGAPAEPVGDRARCDAREQDAEQQAAHHGADRAAARPVVGERRGERHEQLRRARDEADAHVRRDEKAVARARRHRDERDDIGDKQPHDQRMAIDDVAERHDDEEARRVAELRQRDEIAELGGLAPEARRDRREKRLRIIEVADDDAAGAREQQRHPARQRGGGSGDGIHEARSEQGGSRKKTNERSGRSAGNAGSTGSAGMPKANGRPRCARRAARNQPAVPGRASGAAFRTASSADTCRRA